MRYTKLRKELLTLLEEDQREVRECSKTYRKAMHVPRDTWDRFLARAHERAKRVLDILDDIGEPTIENVGPDGSQAISVLALHSRLSVMKRVLGLFEASYSTNPASVYFEAIPSLTDRALILERKKQRFGTQWMLGADGKFFLPPVKDFEHMNELRATYGLGESKHPIDLTDGIPNVEPARSYTQASDQRPPTEQEFNDFTYGQLD